MSRSHIQNRIFIVANGIDHQAGGLTQAILNRAKSFDGSGLNTTILTFNDDIKSRKSHEELVQQRRIPGSLSWINVYDYYREQREQPESLVRRVKQSIRHKLIDNLQIIKLTHDTRAEGGNIRVDFHHRHILSKKKIFDSHGKLLYITFFNKKGRPTLRKIYGGTGVIQRMVKVHPKTGQPTGEWRYTRDGFCYLYRKAADDDFQTELYERSGVKTTYESQDAFRVAWLNEIMSKQQVKPICIFDSPEMGVASLSMKPSLAHRVVMLHGYQYDDTEPRARDMRLHMLRQLKNIEQLVVLTDRQRDDIVKDFGDFDNVTVIANSARPSRLKSVPAKDPKLISLIARFAPQKQIDQAIQAFAQVVDAVPDARLNIYGRGDGIDDIKQLVRRLSLEANVHFAGYMQARDMDEAYAKSLVCVMTSKYEGLPLSLLESMLHATPYVAYDLRYGPSDVIVDGKTGYVVPQGDIDAMAATLIRLLNNPKEAIGAGKRAQKEVYKRYSETVILQQWMRLFNQLLTDE